MKSIRRVLWLTACVVALAPLGALSQDAAGPHQRNRDRLAEIRKEPRAYARLIADARAFLELPAERQARIRKLDDDLHRLPARERKHLLEVMQRYASWLEGLPAEQRRQIEQAADARARLELVRQLRERQWISTLPKRYRDELATLKGEDRKKRIAKLRRDELAWRARWQLAFNHWKELTAAKKKPLPASLDDFHNGDKREQEVAVFIEQYLLPRLSKEDQDRLKKAEGKWPLYPCTLVDLAARHPPARLTKQGPTSIKALPKLVKDRLQLVSPKKDGPWVFLVAKRKTWPDFAIAVTKIADIQDKSLPYELWPTQRKHLSPGMQDFLKNKLEPLLDEHERETLNRTKGWPDFPELIQQLADRHGLEVPWQTLPGPRSYWDGYRVKNYHLVENW